MAREQKASTKGVGSRDWRGRKVFFCQTPGCGFDHESEAVVQAHIDTGNHRVRPALKELVKDQEEPVASEEPAEGSDD